MKRPRSIAEDIQQTTPFRSRGHEALVSILRTSDDVRRFFTAIVATEEITLPQYNVLRILRGAGPDGLPTLDVAERMLQRQPGVTRLVDRLIDKGLVTRCRGEEDRRRVICSITDAGLETVERLEGPMARGDREVMGVFDPDEAETLLDLLDRIRLSISSAEASDPPMAGPTGA